MPLSQPTQNILEPKRERKILKCSECNIIRSTLDEIHQICYVCYKTKTLFKSSGNKVIDDFIRHTQINYCGNVGWKMEFVPYDQFEDIEFIAEGGFSKIYKATWIDGPINNWRSIINNTYDVFRKHNYTIVLKKLNNSKNVTSKELNELKIFYQVFSKGGGSLRISNYFGITQDPITKDIMIIMPYYNSGDLIHYIGKDFYNFSWERKLGKIWRIIIGLVKIHELGIIHRDLHSGNIFVNSGDGVNHVVIEIFQGRKYTMASDIYSFGMIMWEFMTGRRPFWNEIHDIELIIEICDGLRPPIVTNAPEGYIELMKEC
ncbi:kinase-like domain-containing protein [Glomus cerebriforme]|uniref:Kinase-like domain-containing protein n=1 Tax=Glomus cerebriforme TaxID=658196 RepID=A0A397SSJ8_9GLOM|nr:kinase-like domain-containing protein [Glomus cerebriforme]